MSGSGLSGRPDALASSATAALRYPLGAFAPVPTAVPPRATARSPPDAARACAAALDMAVAHAPSSPPSVTGRASIRWVRPIFACRENSFAFLRSDATSASAAAATGPIAVMTDTCIAVGYVSLLDCDMLTWSLGWRREYSPLLRPILSRATLATTSLAFMLNAVPAPELIMSTANWSRNLPPSMSSHAYTMALPRLASRAPTFMLAIAAERFIMTNASTRSGWAGRPVTRYCSRALAVNGP